jgi:hypothetical protein
MIFLVLSLEVIVLVSGFTLALGERVGARVPLEPRKTDKQKPQADFFLWASQRR